MADATPQLSKPRCTARTVTGWTILLFVLLRVAIGWHLAYEGIWKLKQDDWVADQYLIASSGPFRPIFRMLVPDADGFQKMEKENLLARMDARAEQAITHYSLTPEQTEILTSFLERKKSGIQDENNIKSIFENETFQTELAQYREQIARGESPDRDRILDWFTPVFEDLEQVFMENLIDAQRAKGDPPPMPPIVPENAPDPDPLDWLTEQYKADAIKRQREENAEPLSQERLEALEMQYMMDKVHQRWHQLDDHYELQQEDWQKLKEDFRKSFDPQPKEAGFETLWAERRTQLEVELHRRRQSANGWRYRDQKKIGGERDPNNVERIFADPELHKQIADYRKLCEEIEEKERTLGGDYILERKVNDYGKKATAKRAILARIEIPLNDIDPSRMMTFNEEMFVDINDELSDEQLKAGPMPREKRHWLSHMVNWGNMIGLTAAGLCLVFGLFTRFSALVGAALLALYYFAMPPWPGLPESPMAEGHYMIVNKNLIEMIALLMIATSGIGRWVGLDAFIHAICCRKRATAG